jgi:hypothetical protein
MSRAEVAASLLFLWRLSDDLGEAPGGEQRGSMQAQCTARKAEARPPRELQRAITS